MIGASGAWRKSSFSNGNGGNQCVEVARNPAIPGKVFVRNSTNPLGSVVMFTDGEWSAFLAGVKNGEFDE